MNFTMYLFLSWLGFVIAGLVVIALTPEGHIFGKKRREHYSTQNGPVGVFAGWKSLWDS